MGDNLNDKIKKISVKDQTKYNLSLRSEGKPASSFEWRHPEDADGVPILARTMVSNSDPNVKIAYDNFATIQNEKAAYLAGNITRTFNEDVPEDVQKKYQDFDRLNNFYTLLPDMMSSNAGWGNTYSLCYLDDNNKARIKEIPAWNAKVMNDKDGEPLEAYVYYPKEDSKETKVYHYDKINVSEYELNSEGKETLIETKPHGFTELPVIDWINNKQRRGNSQKAVTLMDAHDRLMSDGVTEWATFRNAYLMLSNMGTISEEDKADMQKTGVIIGDGENAKAEFITKEVSPEFTKLMCDKVWQGIWVVASSVDPVALSNLGNATAFQIKQMYRLMEQDAQNTQKRWEKSLELLDRVLKSYWTGLSTPAISDYDTFDINYEFPRNVPSDTLSELEALKRAGGNLPQEEIFRKYGYSEDKAEELAKLSSEELTMGLPNLDEV